MKIPVIPFALLSIAVFPFVGWSQTAIEIATEFENQKIAAMEKYIVDNPSAKDVDQAYSILVNAQMAMNKMEAVLDILDKRYSLAPKGEKAVLGTLIGEISRPYIEISSQIGEKDRGKKFVNQLKADLAPHPESAQINGFIDQIAADLYVPGVGDTMNLTFKATSGQEVDVAAMKGKVILIDFWATWCGPCIQEMPNVIAAYEEYHDKGFEVIGISLDDDLAALEKFMAANGMVWPQYFDGKSWGNELAGEYGIKGIPATFLIGKEGKIVATNLRGNELEMAIKHELGL
ncbi:MAG: TlpA disulfide reductase family protein [Verrucomicrobiales bacterium]|nr:TlpA disulfide reductase family protein [Verrucomicrobiales bacterium]